jgi:hypothetical protein
VLPETNSGIGQEITFAGAGNAVTFSAPVPVGQIARFTPTLFQIQSGSRLIQISATNGFDFGSVNGVLFDSADGAGRQIVVKNQSGGAWDYGSSIVLQEWQTYGYWAVDNLAAGNHSGAFGSFSVGAATAGSSIPTVGTFTFRGDLLGDYIHDGLISTRVGASVSLAVDFANRTAGFSSADWADSAGSVAGTALHGTLSYGSGQNALSGQLTTANGALSGPAVAQFYGPAAQEVGGAFTLIQTNGGQERLVGGFGARR